MNFDRQVLRKRIGLDKDKFFEFDDSDPFAETNDLDEEISPNDLEKIKQIIRDELAEFFFELYKKRAIWR